MRSASAIVIVGLLVTTAGCPTGPGNQDGSCDSTLPMCPTEVPSWSASIQPTVNARCVTCHYPGSAIAHNDFSTYAEVSADRGSILGQVYGCAMPPADGEPLTNAERTALLTWLVCGAPEH